jgi:Flp pilus assembly pilin Flp
MTTFHQQNALKIWSRSEIPVHTIRIFAHHRLGATSIEYAAIAGAVAVAIVFTVQGLGSKVNALFMSVLGAF